MGVQRVQRVFHKLTELRPARFRTGGSSAEAPGFAPGQLREMSRRLCRVAADERSRSATAASGVLAELRRRPRDVLGGSVDAERGSARLRFPDLELVVASADIRELRTVVWAAQRTAVGLSTAVVGTIGPTVLVFTVDDWTVTVAADAVLRARPGHAAR